jgi:hypothetical protein
MIRVFEKIIEHMGGDKLEINVYVASWSKLMKLNLVEEITAMLSSW